jgi:hypothetical protein
MTGEDTNGGSAVGWEFTKAAGWHADTHLVTNPCFDEAGVSCGSCNLTTVAWAKFKIVDCRTLRNVLEGCDVSRTKGCIVTNGDR